MPDTETTLRNRRRYILLGVIVLCFVAFLSIDIAAAQLVPRGPKRCLDCNIGFGSPAPFLTFRKALEEPFKFYPSAKIGTGILLEMGAVLNRPLVKKANGIATDGVPQTFDDIKLSQHDFWEAYGDLARSAFTNENLLPKTENLDLLAQPLVERGVNPISLAVIKYNEFNPDNFASGTLSLFYADGTRYPTSTTFGSKSLARDDGRISYVKETPASSTTPLTSLFVGTGFLRGKADGTISNYLLFSLPSQFVIKNPVATTITDIAIRFPGVPRGDSISPDTFIPIELGGEYPWDMSRAMFVQEAPPSVTMVAHLTYHIRATIDGVVRYAVGTVDYYPPPGVSRGADCSIARLQGGFPKVRPAWWPELEWPPTGNPVTFFTATSSPLWWNSAEIPWPVFFSPYRYTIADLSQVIDWLGVHDQKREDPKVQGPPYTAYDGNATSSVLNTRLYPATYRKPVTDPDRCFVKNLVVLVDGFDIEQNRTPTTMYRDLEPTVNRMRDKGYDVFLVDYADGQDFIQRNALALMEILKNIPVQKDWLKMKLGYENQRAIVIAASMGTQVSRYALAKLEEQGIDHHTGLWIPIDGPFVGAHIPVSIQGLIDFLAEISEDGKPLRTAINSPAAKEMLRRHYTNRLVVPHNYQPRFYGEVKALNGGTGMPRKLRKVAMSQGSGQALTQDQIVRRSNDPLIASFEHLETITFRSLWYGLDIDAKTEGISINSSEPRILDAWVTKPAGFIPFPFVDPPGIPVGRSLYLSYEYEIRKGHQDLDMIPGGSTFAARRIKNAFNNSTLPAKLSCAEAPDGPCFIQSVLDHSPFIPHFSALGYEAAGTGATTEDVSVWKEISYGLATEGELSATFQQTVPSDLWYAPEDPSRFPSAMDPAIKSKSPFDAIWYEPKNVEHVFTTGVRPATSTEAFLFNEMDSFTSQESFSSKIFDPDPKIPSSEIILTGDLTGCSPNEVFTANTMTKKAMVQRFNAASSTWQKVWESTSSAMIGDWKIDKGDKFFLPKTMLFPGDGSFPEGKTELFAVGANTSSTAKLLKLFKSSPFTPPCGVPPATEYSWATVWSNGGSGYLGPWKLHPTDLIAFGNAAANRPGEPDEREELSIAHPYIGNNERERLSPGKGGRSEAAVFRVIGGAQMWDKLWDNQSINFIGTPATGWPVRFGDYLEFGKLGGSNFCSLFSLNQLQDIFSNTGDQRCVGGTNAGASCTVNADCGFVGVCVVSNSPAVMWQKFDLTRLPTSNPWLVSWFDAFPANFGSWNVGNPEDAFAVADIDGDGIDEVISYNTGFFHAQNFDLASSTWTLKYSPDPISGSVFGNYPLQSGDRLYAGNFDGDPKEEILVVNPSSTTAMLQKFNPASLPKKWDVLWQDDGSHMLGFWPLYER